MLKIIFSLFSFCLVSTALAQEPRPFNSQNAREGESVEYCRQHTYQNELFENDPAAKERFEQGQIQLKSELAAKKAESKGEIPAKATLYRIPVVFHIMHNNGPEAISNAQVHDAMRILNRDYARLNPDANLVYTEFQGNPAAVDIEFVFATKAPDGTCFSGITRTVSSATSSGNGQTQRTAIVNGNDVYNGNWAGDKYLNIYVCEDIGGAAGYTYLPGSQGTSMSNGIFVLSEYVGSIGTGDDNRSRTLTHEVGHWLNLPHVWGGTNNPGISTNCSNDSFYDDGVDDTPETIGNTSCNLFANSCSLDNAYWGFDKVDNVENYMDYSYCSKMFTPGQALQMRTALESSVGGRSTIKSAANLIAVGADSNITVCKADFVTQERDICIGSTITFTDSSYHNAQSWSWSFPGGTPSTSTAQNPVVTYPNSGDYAVTLTVFDGANSTSTTKPAYINVRPTGVSLMYSEGFEGYTSLTNTSSFWTPSSNVGNKFELYTGTGSEGNQCVRLRNFTENDEDTDILTSDNFDLSGYSSSDVVTFSFKYAHRKRTTSNYEILRFQVSNDCGRTWSTRKTIAGSALSTEVVATEWVPTAADFVQTHVVGINSSYFGGDILTRFSFDADGGNNLYLDQINFYDGPQTVLGLEEETLMNNINVFPNPSEGDLNIKFNMNQTSSVDVVIRDISGKLIKSATVNATSGENLVLMDTQELASGMYFLTLVGGPSNKTLQFVKK